jgi:hypothetical protein
MLTGNCEDLACCILFRCHFIRSNNHGDYLRHRER